MAIEKKLSALFLVHHERLPGFARGMLTLRTHSMHPFAEVKKVSFRACVSGGGHWDAWCRLCVKGADSVLL
jgi:hypothetical protein